MKIFKEFKEFAIKGNMFDMAIGVIIGTAFGKIITAIVGDIMLPLLSPLVGSVDLSNLSVTVKEEVFDPSGRIIQEQVLLNYGNFMQVTFDFFIIAIIVFLTIKIFNKLRNKAEDETEESIPTPRNIQLLAEIRDLLKDKKS